LAIVVARRSWREISLGKGTKKEKTKKERKKEREFVSKTAELNRRVQVTAINSWGPTPTEKWE
jgi:hypothetical protein